MGIHFKVHLDKRLLVGVWVGPVSDEEVVQAYREIYLGSENYPLLNEIADLRQADMSAVTAESLRQVADIVASITAEDGRTFKTAVIAERDLPYGIARMYGSISDGSGEETRVFRKESEALSWLGVERSVLE